MTAVETSAALYSTVEAASTVDTLDAVKRVRTSNGRVGPAHRRRALVACAVAFALAALVHWLDLVPLARIGLQQMAGKKYNKRRVGPLPFQASAGKECLADKPIRVAVVGGGIAGLTAAYTLTVSNERRAALLKTAAGDLDALEPCRDAADAGCLPALYNVTLFEATPRLGGHSWTVQFPLANGKSFPVDVAYAYNPTMPQYEIIRAFERAHGLQMAGPLQQHVSVLREGFRPVSEALGAALNAECDRFVALVEWVKAHKVLAMLLYGPMTLRRALWLHGFSDDFFIYRMYPVIRFVIVAGSKAAMLDSSALAGLQTFKSGWASCYDAQLHGSFDWYTVRNGSEAHVDVLRQRVGHAIRTHAPVRSVRLNRGGRRGADVRFAVQADGKGLNGGGAKGRAAAGAKGGGGAKSGGGSVVAEQEQEEHFDAVIMATAPDDAAAVLGPDAPGWIARITTENITIVVHSDERVMGKPPAHPGRRLARDASAPAAHGASGAPGVNMVYVAKEMGRDVANAALSVYWDSVLGMQRLTAPTADAHHSRQPPRAPAQVHGVLVKPRPILTYNPEAIVGSERLAGEVFRQTFK